MSLRIDQKHVAYALPADFFTTSPSGELVFDGQCIEAAVALAFDEMTAHGIDVKWNDQKSTASFLRPHLFNTVVMYWERAGRFPTRPELELALCSVDGMPMGSSWEPAHACNRASSWLLKDYEKITIEYAHRMLSANAQAYAEARACRQEKTVKMELALRHTAKTFRPFVLPTDFFPSVPAGEIVFTSESFFSAFELAMNQLWQKGDDFLYLGMPERARHIANYLHRFRSDVVQAAARQSGQFPSLKLIGEADCYLNHACQRYECIVPLQDFRSKVRLWDEVIYQRDKSAFELASLEHQLAGKFPEQAVTQPVLKRVLL